MIDVIVELLFLNFYLARRFYIVRPRAIEPRRRQFILHQLKLARFEWYCSIVISFGVFLWSWRERGDGGNSDDEERLRNDVKSRGPISRDCLPRRRTILVENSFSEARRCSYFVPTQSPFSSKRKRDLPFPGRARTRSQICDSQMQSGPLMHYL